MMGLDSQVHKLRKTRQGDQGQAWVQISATGRDLEVEVGERSELSQEWDERLWATNVQLLERCQGSQSLKRVLPVEVQVDTQAGEPC
jgi:hypothetical protein